MPMRPRDDRGFQPTAPDRYRSIAAVAVLAWVCALLASPRLGLALVAAQVEVGYGTTCAIDAADGLWCWGRNHRGQLGDGTTVDSSTPVAVVGLGSGVAAVAPGGDVTCALTAAGGAKCWGFNNHGQLGNGSTTDSSTPIDVFGLTSGVAAVAAGSSSACALTTGGGVKCWGYNVRGTLGDGTNTDSSIPVDVVGLASGVVSIVHGGGHVCALTSGGGVKCWGANFSGELGNGLNADSNVPVDVVGLASGVASLKTYPGVADTTCVLTTTGGVKCWGAITSGAGTVPYDIDGLTSGVDAISAGGQTGLALLPGGAVKAFGLPFSPGPPADVFDVQGLTSGIAAVAGGANSNWSQACVLTTAGEIKCWGRNVYGEVGEGTGGGKSVPGCVIGFGDSDFDRMCDAADPCTGGGSTMGTPPPRLVLSRINTDTTIGNDRLTFRARFALPGGLAFGDLDPIADGARLTLVDPGGIAVDRSFAPAAYAGPGTAGWTINGSGKKWTFTDSTGPNGRLTGRLTLSDKGSGLPGGAVDVNVVRNNETLPVTPTETALQAIFIPGDAAAGAAGTCVQTNLVGLCQFNPRGTTLTCK